MVRISNRSSRNASHCILYHATCEVLEDRRLLSKTVYVDVNAPGSSQGGTAWDHAYADLQLALNSTTAGDTRS